jgi:soluble lytic murein transglycosylase
VENHAARKHAAENHAAKTSKRAAAAAHRVSSTPARSNFNIQELEKLSRALKTKDGGSAYDRLSVAAGQKSSESLGLRAALALGYYDYGRGRYAQAAKWLAVAKTDSVLRDYALYWGAQTDIAQGNNPDALGELQRLRKEYPDSVMTEQALESLGEAALAANRPQDAISALLAYPLTAQRPMLLFLRGQARERAGALLESAIDYQTLYMRFATSELGRQAGVRLDFVRASSPAIPALPLDDRFAHANILFDAKDWEHARSEYARLLPELTGASSERAQLRIRECGMSLGAGISDVASLTIIDPEVDAERFSLLSDFYRNQHMDSEVNAAVETTVQRAPMSRWAESALFSTGNYYWVQLNRDQASSYYKRLADDFPQSPNAAPAHWRVAWTATLARRSDAHTLLADDVRLFPGSPFTPDAVYWLGRLSEEANETPLARGYYKTVSARFPLNYFGSLAAERLRTIGASPMQDPGIQAQIPPLPPAADIAASVATNVPSAASATVTNAAGNPEPAPVPRVPSEASRQARADALRSIAFDSSAELELRAAYAATGDSHYLLEAAQEAAAAQQFGAALLTVRQMYPQLEARAYNDLPREAWLAAYALPFQSSIKRWSAANKLDPMLVSALIHQESLFQPQARSPKNALGLMQLLPSTARRMAKQSKVGYSQGRLFDPDYNIRLGTVYFAGLQKQFGTFEAALAAYNAGEDRVIAWTAGPPYRETAEFVDSIPFTETRQYVEIIARNATIYRRLYGENSNDPPSGTSATRKRRRK